MARFIPPLNVENGTIKAVVFMIGLLSVLIGLGSLGIVKYFRFNAPQFYGFFLLLGAIVLLIEERAWQFDNWTANKIIVSIVMLFGLSLGIWQVMGNLLSSSMQGVAGILYIFLGVLVVRAMFT
ncbi:MAG: hypothetical protein DRP42_03280 [Tenericutes bacterium]|nr:MAG: hypothetical protein DRP42_03280 [Mycoplasmatota bacterium]